MHGKLHRDDGPAIEYDDMCNSAWYRNGKWHRDDLTGSRVERTVERGNRMGKPHRDDGPAIEHGDGHQDGCATVR